MDKLFLLKPNFGDLNIGDSGQQYYCPHCAMIEGVLSYYPQLKEKIQLIYIEFPRPRHQLIEFVGKENQGCPNLVISKNKDSIVDTSYFNKKGDYLFVNKKELIARYLADKYHIAIPHP